MFFAEVRQFEEIFRQGEQPPAGSAEKEGQQGQNAQEAGQLAELQKQIINGTWKLIRRETRKEPTDKFAEDAKTLRDSQKAVIEQAGQLGERLRDATSKANLETAVGAMKDAEKHLGGAADGPSIPALGPALTAEQAAYQALLEAPRPRVPGHPQPVAAQPRQPQLGPAVATAAPAARALQRREPLRGTAHGPLAARSDAAGARAGREPAGAQPAPRAGPAADRPERAAQGAAIGPRSRQDAAGPRGDRAPAQAAPRAAASRSSATPTSSASGWSARRTSERMAEARQQVEQSREPSARRPRPSRRTGSPRPSPRAPAPASS